MKYIIFQPALLDQFELWWSEAAVHTAQSHHSDQHCSDALQRGHPVWPVLRLLCARNH